MSRFLSRLRRGIAPRIAYTVLALGGLKAGSALAQEIDGTGQNQSATVTVPPGGRACLGKVKGTSFLRATGNATAPLDYFMRRSDSGDSGTFTRIPFSDIANARQDDFTIDVDGRPDLRARPTPRPAPCGWTSP